MGFPQKSQILLMLFTMWKNHLVLISRGKDKTSYIPAFYQGLGRDVDQPFIRLNYIENTKPKTVNGMVRLYRSPW